MEPVWGLFRGFVSPFECTELCCRPIFHHKYRSRERNALRRVSSARGSDRERESIRSPIDRSLSRSPLSFLFSLLPPRLTLSLDGVLALYSVTSVLPMRRTVSRALAAMRCFWEEKEEKREKKNEQKKKTRSFESFLFFRKNLFLFLPPFFLLLLPPPPLALALSLSLSLCPQQQNHAPPPRPRCCSSSCSPCSTQPRSPPRRGGRRPRCRCRRFGRARRGAPAFFVSSSGRFRFRRSQDLDPLPFPLRFPHQETKHGHSIQRKRRSDRGAKSPRRRFL
jgi:hypothetical protein